MKCYNKKSVGKGLLNSVINKLPFEMHIPGYNYCGPGTKVKQRLARGDKGINELDEACKDHDIVYLQNKDLTKRHEADKVLATKALERWRSSNAKLSEKMASLGVAGAMKAKLKLGMAYNNLNSKRKNSYFKVINKCRKSIGKIKKTTEKSLEIIDACLKDIQNIKTTTPIEKANINKRIKDNQKNKMKDEIRRKHQNHLKNKNKKEISIDADHDDDDNHELMKTVQRPKLMSLKRRKKNVVPTLLNTDTKTDQIGKKRKISDTVDDVDDDDDSENVVPNKLPRFS